MPNDPIITLPNAAQAGGVFVTLESSDPSTVAITPNIVLVPEGSTTPASQPTVSAVGIGSATITAFALGHISASRTITVPAPTMKFSSSAVSLAIGEMGSLNLTLSGGKAPAAGLQAKLVSSDPSKVAVPLTVTFAPGSTTVTVSISGTAAGSANITAMAPGIANTAATVTVTPPPKVAASYGANFLQVINVVLTNTSRVSAINLRITSVTEIVADAPNKIVLRANTPIPFPFGTLPGERTAVRSLTFEPAAGSIAVPFRFTITYQADNMPPQTAVIAVPFPRSMDFAGSPLTVNAGETGTLTLNLLGSQAPPAGLIATLSSSDPTKARVPASVTFPKDGISVPVAVTGVNGGTVTITAQATVVNFPATATASVKVAAAPSIAVSEVSARLGEATALFMQLSEPAPTGGLTVSLVSSDTTKATVTPSTVSIPPGARAPLTQPQVNGTGIGSATVTAAAKGYKSGMAPVNIPGPTMAFSRPQPSIAVGESLNLTLSLAGGRAPTGGLTIALRSSDSAIAKIPLSVNVVAGATEVTVLVLGVAPGSTTITASAPGIKDSIFGLTVTPAGKILVPPSFSVGLGQRLGPYAVSLSVPAPAGGLSVKLTSDDPSRVTDDPSVLPILEGRTEPGVKPFLTGVGIGSATITAAATGYTPGTGTATVSAPTMAFTGSPFTIPAGGSGNLTLTLTAGQAPAGGLPVSLISSDAGKAALPKTANFPAGATSLTVQVTGVAAGSATITATAPNIASATATVNVIRPAVTISYAGPDNASLARIKVVLKNTSSVAAVNLRITDIKVVFSPPPNMIVFDPTVAGNPNFPLLGLNLAGGASIGPIVFGFRATAGSLNVPFRFAVAYQADNMEPQTALIEAPFPRLISFSGSPLVIDVGASGKLVLDLGGPAPAGGLTVNIKSSDPGKAAVPPTVVIPAGTNSVSVSVKGIAPGMVVITASTHSLGSATATVLVGGSH